MSRTPRCCWAWRHSGVVGEQGAADRLGAEVGAATKAGADVGGDAEDDDAGVGDRVELALEGGLDGGLVGDVVEGALHGELLGAAGRDEVQAAAGGAQEQAELVERVARGHRREGSASPGDAARGDQRR
jgi:hypothetical protein